jgi:hypothetical protein
MTVNQANQVNAKANTFEYYQVSDRLASLVSANDDQMAIAA